MPKIHKKKPRKTPRHKSSKLLVLVAFSFLGVTAFLLLFHANTPKLHPLALLPVPKESAVISLPGPLEKHDLSNSFVLGAETVAPIDIVTYVNEERMKRGARPLRINPILTKAAQMRADVIMKHQNFSHQDPYEHIQLDTVLPMLNYTFSWATENIGMGDTTGRQFVSGFMNSPPHRENLLNPQLVETGVAIASGPFKQYYVTICVQIFGIPTNLNAYLGYTEKDVEDYKNLLADIGKQLELTRKLKEQNPDQADYYGNWERLLIRQQGIIANLSHAMEDEKPFAREMIAMIKTYNANWASVPVKN